MSIANNNNITKISEALTTDSKIIANTPKPSKIPKLQKSIESTNIIPNSNKPKLETPVKSQIPQLLLNNKSKATKESKPPKTAIKPKIKSLKPTVFNTPTPLKKLNKPSTKPLKLINSSTFDKKLKEQHNEKPSFNKQKRVCFPTLKSSSLYYNNQYFNEYKGQLHTTFKYLSDSDLNSLVDRFSLNDKDILYNVYHLDTLYNNIDYILFNSYASDTELAYDINRQHNERYKRLLTSNYKLFINDYFNKTYQEDYSNDQLQNDSESDGEQTIAIEVNEEEFSLEDYNQVDSYSDINEEDDENNLSEEIIEFEFDEYEIEDSLQNSEFGVENEEFMEYSIDKNYYKTDNSTFNDVYLQINENSTKVEDLYLVQIKSPHFSINSLSSLLTTSKSYMGEQNTNKYMLNSSLTSSLGSSRSSLTVLSNTRNNKNYSKPCNDHTITEAQHFLYDEDSLQNFDLNEFAKNINVSFFFI